ncbi:MAG: acetylornithine/succinylornithine family transaminase [Promethearchaeota archaeon]|jgi:predicted acetylornithine/succinylornithine family transaminase
MVNEWIERGKKVIMNTYSQFPIVLEKGEGVHLWDSKGKKYIDFVAGIAVNSLGYNNSDYVKEISTQLGKLQHCSNLYWMPPSIELGELLVKNSCFDKIFYCNSGAEAVEAAIKLSKKYGKKAHGENCTEIITMKKSFHGRTMATVTATGQTKYQKGYDPLLPGFSYVEFNNFENLEKKVNENICAIIIEPIQGEGGINPAEKKYLQQVRALCDKYKIVLIFDEVQCGIGRTGELFAYQIFDIKPDVVSLAKGLGGGFPIGAMMAIQSKADAFQPGDHASTFGGNYLACTAGKVVIKKLLYEGVLENVQKQGDYFKEKLIGMQKRYEIIKDVRGYGLMLGIELNCPVKDIVSKCMEKGLLILGAGENVIRFVPPLIINKEEIDEGLGILDDVLEHVNN